MSPKSCPTCKRLTPRALEAPHELGAEVDYYRCDLCGTVWHAPKDDPNGSITFVAIPSGGPAKALVKL